MAMSAEGLTAIDTPLRLVFVATGADGRSQHYLASVKDHIVYQLDRQLRQRGGCQSDAPTLAVVGLADIPALMLLGQALGDRSRRLRFSSNREHQLRWPHPTAQAPDFLLHPP
ncbi:hypothetical protein [Aeromonas hydrophila]|uniref:hypothetical protein n=1 Tax=Aeromonas hydrophila TaxID=644 RepID=UPI0038D250B6